MQAVRAARKVRTSLRGFIKFKFFKKSFKIAILLYLLDLDLSYMPFVSILD